MGGDDVSFLEVGDGTDDFAVFGEEAVTHAVDTFGIAGSESLFEQFDTMATDEYLPFSGAMQADEEIGDTGHLVVHSMDQPFGDSGRGLEGFVCDKVEHGDVTRVADTGDNRQFVLGAVGTEGVVIETTQIGGGTAAADDYDCVVKVIGDW